MLTFIDDEDRQIRRKQFTNGKKSKKENYLIKTDSGHFVPPASALPWTCPPCRIFFFFAREFVCLWRVHVGAGMNSSTRRACYSASLCKISLKSENWLLSYGQKRFLKWQPSAMLNFKKYTFGSSDCHQVPMYSCTKFHQSRMIFRWYGDLTIFKMDFRHLEFYGSNDVFFERRM